eukprot:184530_1
MSLVTQSLVDRIDTGLADYYKKHNRVYYIKINGIDVGKFKQYLNETGLDDDDKQIKEELEAGLEDCTILDFDNQFPLDSSEILKMLRDFAGLNKTTKKYTLDVGICIGITEDEMKETGEKYLTQIDLKTEKYIVLRYFLTVGIKSGFPFLTYMIDCYTNDNTKHYIKTKESWNIETWSEKNQFMKVLKKKNATKVKQLATAMTNYNIRIMPRLKFQTTAKVKDLLEPIVEYIVSTPVFLQKLMDQLKGGTPFQVDLMFAVNDVQNMVAIEKAKEKLLSDQDEYDDDDEKGDENKPIQKHIGDIRKKLKEYPLHYCISHNELKKEENEEKDKTIETITRLLTDTYKDFTTILDKKDKKYDFGKYPQRRRFSIFVDRRNRNDCDDLNALEAQLTFFQPPDDCNAMETDHVPEIGFGLVRKCLIPKLKHEKDSITALDNLSGRLITFVFCVEQMDEIRCYIIWNGQCMRFQSEHIRTILPNLFINWQENINFINDDRMKQMEEIFDKHICDRIFDPFYREVTAIKKS